LVAALLRFAGVTAGLAESNGSLPPGLWLMSPAGWLTRIGISSGTLRPVIEYGLPLPFLVATAQLQQLGSAYTDGYGDPCENLRCVTQHSIRKWRGRWNTLTGGVSNQRIGLSAAIGVRTKSLTWRVFRRMFTCGERYAKVINIKV